MGKIKMEKKSLEKKLRVIIMEDELFITNLRMMKEQFEKNVDPKRRYRDLKEMSQDFRKFSTIEHHKYTLRDKCYGITKVSIGLDDKVDIRYLTIDMSFNNYPGRLIDRVMMIKRPHQTFPKEEYLKIYTVCNDNDSETRATALKVAGDILCKLSKRYNLTFLDKTFQFNGKK